MAQQVVNPFESLLSSIDFEASVGELISFFVVAAAAVIMFTMAQKAVYEILIMLEIVEPSPEYEHRERMKHDGDYANSYNNYQKKQRERKRHKNNMRNPNYRFMHNYDNPNKRYYKSNYKKRNYNNR